MFSPAFVETFLVAEVLFVDLLLRFANRLRLLLASVGLSGVFGLVDDVVSVRFIRTVSLYLLPPRIDFR